MYKKEISSKLKMMSGKKIDLLIEGMITTRMIFDKLKFESIYDIFKLKDDNNNYFMFNTNQITKLTVDSNIEIVTDSDITIFIKEIKNAY